MSGTKSACFKGKSTLIPYLFEGLHPDLSVSRTKTNSRWQWNNVDVLCTDETFSKWVVTDFHSRIESTQAKNLLKAMLAHSSLHLLNSTLVDFDEITGELSAELAEIIEWQISHTTSTVVLLIRDFKFIERSKLATINENLNKRFVAKRVILLTLENISDKEDSNRLFRIEKVMNNLKEITAASEFHTKPMHSIRDVKLFFENLCENPNFNNKTIHIMNEIEVEFENLFKVRTLTCAFILYFVLNSFIY